MLVCAHHPPNHRNYTMLPKPMAISLRLSCFQGLPRLHPQSPLLLLPRNLRPLLLTRSRAQEMQSLQGNCPGQRRGQRAQEERVQEEQLQRVRRQRRKQKEQRIVRKAPRVLGPLFRRSTHPCSQSVRDMVMQRMSTKAQLKCRRSSREGSARHSSPWLHNS